MKYFIPAIRFKIFMTILLGLIYPFAMTTVSQAVFPTQANGEFVSRGGQVVGSLKIAQKFEKPEYFWPRPSAIDYNPLPSGGSNLGQASAGLKKAYAERKAKLKAAHPEQSGEPPQDLLFASGSGLDPHISPASAEYQMQRVAKVRRLDLNQIRELILQASTASQVEIFGEPTVNVLALNLSLDKAQGIETAPALAPTPEPTAAPKSAVPSGSDQTK